MEEDDREFVKTLLGGAGQTGMGQKWLFLCPLVKL